MTRSPDQVQAYVEYLVVADASIYNSMSIFVQSNDSSLILESIRIYYAHVVNGVYIF